MKKKTIIIGIGGIIAITGAIVIPIIIIGNKNNNEQKNKEDVEAIIKILKSKPSSQKTLILEGNSTGKIISNNKEKIITKIKKLIGIKKLRGVKFDVSLENDVDISTTEKFIIIIVKKEKQSQQLKGENGLKVKRAKNVQEIKIDTIKEYLKNLDNLNLTLPKTSYSSDNEILVAIRKLLATQINNIEIDDTNLIIKKENSSEVVLVATHGDEETTLYEITIDDEDFTLKLKQEEFSEDEKNVKNIKQSLKTLISKEITIDASSGSINNNKNSILRKLQTLSGYPPDLKGVSLSIKDSSDLINLEGIAFTILLSKGSVINQELRGFTVKRSQSQAEIDQNDVNEIKQSLKTLISKEITIDASSGSINNNKNSILRKLQTLSGYPPDLKGVSLFIKDSSDLINLEGIAFTILLSKGSVVNQELREFTVKRSQSQAEIDQNDVNEIKQPLETLISKEITIDASSGSINNNKNSILRKLQTLSGYPPDLKGVSLSIKDSSDLINLEGVAFTILLSKGSVVNQELRGFIVKRSQSQTEIDQNDVNEIKQSLENLISKEITIDASSGSINNNKNSILKKLQTLSGYPSDLKGVSLSIKDSSDSITLEGVAFTILLSKGSVVNQELREFTVKRSQSQAEIDQNDVNEIKQSLETLISKELTIDASSGSINNNKNSILEKLQTLSGYPSDLKGVIVSIKEEETEINLEGVAFTILLSKGSVVNQELREFTVKRSQSQTETDQNDVDEIKQLLNALNLKEITIDASSGSITTNKNSILEKLQALSGYPLDLKGVSLSIKDSSDSITLEGVAFTIWLSKGSVVNQELRGFKVKRSQTPTEKIKNNIKEYLKISINLNIFLPKDTGSDYDEDSKILTAIRKKLEILKPLDFSKNYFDNLINKKQPSTPNTEVATHDASRPTSYEITIDDENFVLKLKQNQYTSEEEKNTIINSIKTYLGNEDNLNIILPKDISSNYNEDSKILIAIKTKLIDSIPDFKNYDANLIVKEGSIPIIKVANHDATNPTEYKINVGGEHFTLRLKQDQFTKKEKTKINAIEKHFETSSNLNLILPQTTYSNNDDILNAIKLKLENDIETILSSDSHLINRKDSTIDEVAAYGQPSTQYIIVVGEEEFTLNLNQDQFTEEEKTKINAIEKHFETSSNLNLILPKTTYSNNDDILNAIKLKFINDIEDISSSDSHLINRKDSTIDEVAAHGQPSTQYIIVVGEEEFTLNLNQDQFTELEKTKINAIEKHFETSSNLNLILPQTTYSNNNDILNAIKLKLENDIEGISSSDFHLINRKDSTIDEVALHGQSSTQYIIVVGEHEFTLNLNQDQFSEEEKTKINNIKTYLNNLDNLNLILPKTTYSDDNSVLEAIKLKLINDIEDISSIDSHLIVKKVGSVVVTSVAIHNQPSTQYIIFVGEYEFTLNLNQVQFTKEEKTKINNIKTYLNNLDNLNLILPKTTYSNNDDILDAIKLKLENDIESISSSDSHLINRKDSTIDEVAIHNQPSTKYIIVVGEHKFTLNLNQEEFSEQEKIKIQKIKNYLKKRNTLVFVIPKKTYNFDIQILNAIWLKIIHEINDNEIKIEDSYLIKSYDNIEITQIANHDEITTSYKILVGNQHKFKLFLWKDKFSEEEKNDSIKTYLENLDNFNLILPKTTYNNDNDILNAIKIKIIRNIDDIIDDDSYLIVKKGSTLVTKVATHDSPTPTLYEIIIGEKNFILKLKQDQFNKKEKNNAIKNYLRNLDLSHFRLPKTHYGTDDSILKAIKIKLVNNINQITNDDFHLINKKINSATVYNIPSYGGEGSFNNEYIITINEEDFVLNLFEEQFSEEEKTIINVIKKYLENENNLNLILPKKRYRDLGYEKLKNDLKWTLLSNVLKNIKPNYYNLIDVLDESALILSIAPYGQTSTPYKIQIGNEHEFTLNLNQDEFTIEQKINAIKTYLGNMNTDNFILPKDNYDNDNDILNAIKEEFALKVNKFTTRDYYLITKKESSPEVVEVKSNEGTEVTPYEIFVGGESSTLRLKQSQFTKEEILKINIIKKHFKHPPSIFFSLPKRDYINDDDILNTIRKILVNKIEGISDDDSYLIIKKPGEEDFDISVSIPTSHRDAPSYKIIVGEYSVGEDGFELIIKQDLYNKQEQIQKIKEHIDILNTENNLNFIISKDYNISNDDDILEKIIDIIGRDLDSAYNDLDIINLVIKKVGEEDITSIATFDEDYTIYKITIGEYEYSFKLKKEKYNKEERINEIKKYLEISNNLNITIPKKRYERTEDVLDAVKSKLFKNINNEVPNIRAQGLQYLFYRSTHIYDPRNGIFVEGTQNFKFGVEFQNKKWTFNLNQDQFTESEKTKINAIKTYLKTGDNLNLILPKTTYDNDDSILEAIKLKLVNDIETISSGDSYLIVKKVGSREVTSVAIHGQPPTQYIIVVGENELTLNLNQESGS